MTIKYMAFKMKARKQKVRGETSYTVIMLDVYVACLLEAWELKWGICRPWQLVKQLEK